MKITKTLWAHAAMLTATLLYGANYRIAKVVMPEPLAPFAFIMLRIIGAGVVIWLLHGIFIRERVARRDLGRLFWCGFFGAALNMLLFFKGLSLTSPVNAALVMVAAPILVLGISYAMGKEQLNLQKWVGISLGFCGAMLLFSLGEGTASFSRAGFLGDLMVLGNGASYAMYLVLARPLMQKYHPFTVLKWIFLFGGLCSLPVAWNELWALQIWELSNTQWGHVLFVVFGATALTYVLNISSLRYVHASLVGYYIYIQPVFAIFLDVMLGYAWPSVLKIIAAMLIFSGVYVISSKPPLKPQG